VDKLTSRGFKVKLVHNDKETSRTDHGWVSLIAASGQVVGSSKDYQHNRNFHNRENLSQKMVSSLPKPGDPVWSKTQLKAVSAKKRNFLGLGFWRRQEHSYPTVSMQQTASPA